MFYPYSIKVNKCCGSCNNVNDQYSNICVPDVVKNIWNPSNCEEEWDKSCDVGEYLDYADCKCRKRLIDKLVEECSKNIDKELHSNELISVTSKWLWKCVWVLYNIHSIVSNIFHNKYKH